MILMFVGLGCTRHGLMRIKRGRYGPDQRGMRLLAELRAPKRVWPVFIVSQRPK